MQAESWGRGVALLITEHRSCAALACCAPCCWLIRGGTRLLLDTDVPGGWDPHVSSYVLPGVPVSDVNLETQPPEGQAVEGASLVLVCSVGEGTGTVAFSWHREGEPRSLESRRARSQSAEMRVAAVSGRQAGTYYCAANNGYGSRRSQRVAVTVRGEWAPVTRRSRGPTPRLSRGGVAEGAGRPLPLPLLFPLPLPLPAAGSARQAAPD